MKHILLGFLLLSGFCSLAQVGINTTNPQASLDVREADQAAPTAYSGIAIPQVDILPASGNRGGQLVYLTSNNLYYYYDGITWVPLLNNNTKIKTISGNYTLLASDHNHVVVASSAAAMTITVPAGLPAGFNISVYQAGLGKITFESTLLTLNNRLDRFVTAGQYAGAGLVLIDANTCYITGDLTKS